MQSTLNNTFSEDQKTEKLKSDTQVEVSFVLFRSLEKVKNDETSPFAPTFHILREF